VIVLIVDVMCVRPFVTYKLPLLLSYKGVGTKHHFIMTFKRLNIVVPELEEEDLGMHEPSQGHQV
jgi:hypothetical protein